MSPAGREDVAAAIVVVRHPRARRARLSVDRATGSVRLTLPPRAPLAPALRWAEGKAAWIAGECAQLPRPRPFAPGEVITVADEVLTIVHDGAAPRRAVRTGGTIRFGGRVEACAARITAWLRAEALALLRAETDEFAARIGVCVSGVRVGDFRSRWGSCSSAGAIAYSWRLLLAPGWVRRATVAHEVAHRRHMDHGPRFHALVATLVGDDGDRARAWLRREGAGLHWFGRVS